LVLCRVRFLFLVSCFSSVSRVGGAHTVDGNARIGPLDASSFVITDDDGQDDNNEECQVAQRTGRTHLCITYRSMHASMFMFAHTQQQRAACTLSIAESNGSHPVCVHAVCSPLVLVGRSPPLAPLVHLVLLVLFVSREGTNDPLDKSPQKRKMQAACRLQPAGPRSWLLGPASRQSSRHRHSSS